MSATSINNPSHIRTKSIFLSGGYFKVFLILTLSTFSFSTKSRCQYSYDGDIKTYPCRFASHIVDNTVAQLDITLPFFVNVLAVSPKLDTLFINIHVFVTNEMLSTDTEYLYQMAIRNAEKLMKYKSAPHIVFYSRFCFHNKIGGEVGNSIIWTFNHDTPSAFESEYVPYNGLQIDNPEFWKRADKIQLAGNQVLYIMPDSILQIINFETDSTKFPITSNDIRQTKNILKVLYELVGTETKSFTEIREMFVDRKMKFKNTFRLSVSQTELGKNPNFLLNAYKRHFPYSVPYCGECKE